MHPFTWCLKGGESSIFSKANSNFRGGLWVWGCAYKFVNLGGGKEDLMVSTLGGECASLLET